jgi:hypothetical protein
VPVGVPGVEGDDDSGVLLALSPNPFLDGRSTRVIRIVVNNDNITDGWQIESALIQILGCRTRRQKLRFTEAMILQDIRAYYEGLANALAANRKGDSV